MVWVSCIHSDCQKWRNILSSIDYVIKHCNDDKAKNLLGLAIYASRWRDVARGAPEKDRAILFFNCTTVVVTSFNI